MSSDYLSQFFRCAFLQPGPIRPHNAQCNLQIERHWERSWRLVPGTCGLAMIASALFCVSNVTESAQPVTVFFALFARLPCMPQRHTCSSASTLLNLFWQPAVFLGEIVFSECMAMRSCCGNVLRNVVPVFKAKSQVCGNVLTILHSRFLSIALPIAHGDVSYFTITFQSRFQVHLLWLLYF